MSLHPNQFRKLVVSPALEKIGLHSIAAENLVMGTAAQESRLKYLHQIRGPALGLFQVEPATYRDYWDGYLSDHLAVRDRILAHVYDDFDNCRERPDAERVVWDLMFAAMMCRVHYRRIRAPLPPAGDVEAMAAYWKRYYNTVHGAGTVDEFVRNYEIVA